MTSKINNSDLDKIIDALLVEIICSVHCFFNDMEKTAAWMNAKNLNLGGASPFELIYRGRGKRVLAFIINAIDSNKPEGELNGTVPNSKA